MDKNINRNNKKTKGYFRRTIKNKLVATMLTILGLASLNVSTDGTGLLFFMMFAVPLFFIDDTDED